MPLVNVDEQVAPHEMPAGLLVTVPLPVPALETVSDGSPPFVVNVAVTVVSAVRVTTQVPVPEQPPPLQPVKVEPAAGVAVSVTVVPLAKVEEQVAPQVMPAGELETEPVPVPALLTVSVRGMRVNVAVTDVAAVRVTTQVPVPLQPPPDQPVKLEPVSGVAVSVTAVPWGNDVEQVAPQVMPAGELETEPVPVPALVTVSVRGMRVNVAVTVVSAPSVTTHVPVPEQPPPDHPANVEFTSGDAVRVTAVEFANVVEQVAPQVMPAGDAAPPSPCRCRPWRR